MEEVLSGGRHELDWALDLDSYKNFSVQGLHFFQVDEQAIAVKAGGPIALDGDCLVSEGDAR